MRLVRFPHEHTAADDVDVLCRFTQQQDSTFVQLPLGVRRRLKDAFESGARKSLMHLTLRSRKSFDMGTTASRVRGRRWNCGCLQ